MEELDLRDLAFRESEQVEWKENVADIEKVVATLSAFANDWSNLGGGYVVCGAAEGKDEHGFAVVRTPGLDAARFKEIEGKVMQLCRDQVTPSIVPLVRELPTEDPARRILVFVMPATRHAHSFRRKTDGGMHYIRQSRSTIKARNGLFLQLMVRKGDVEPWDRRPNPEAQVEDLDLLALRDTLQRMSAWDASRSVDDYLHPEHRIFAMSHPLCAREPLTAILRPRNYALLLFGRDVPRFVLGAHVVFSVYPGVDRSEPHSEAHYVHGTLLEQLRILEERLAAQAHTVFDKQDPVEPNLAKYPLPALKEALVNALVHRDYEVSHPTLITVFLDRVEIFSHGSMPPAVDRKAFVEGRANPVWRSQDLAMFCIRLRIAQSQGQGVVTIFRSMQEAGCPPPEFELGEHTVCCVLRANPRTIRGGLLLGFDQAFRPPPSLGLSLALEIPARSPGTDWSRLRAVPIDVAAWEAAVEEIDHGVERALETIRGELHVLIMAPYAAAAFLGRRLELRARARTLHLYQFLPDAKLWESLSQPQRALAMDPYFEPLVEPPRGAKSPAVLLAIDGMHPIPEARRGKAAQRVGGVAYHLRASTSEPMHAAQFPAAVAALRHALTIIGTRHPSTPLHIITSAPVALVLALGRLLTPTTISSAIIHHFVPSTGSYVPVLDVVQGKIVPTIDRLDDPSAE